MESAVKKSLAVCGNCHQQSIVELSTHPIEGRRLRIACCERCGAFGTPKWPHEWHGLIEEARSLMYANSLGG